MRSRATSQRHGVWVPAFAGTTLRAMCIAVILAMTIALLGNAHAQSLSNAKKFSAELAALPATGRAKRSEDGARRDGKLVMVHTLRGALGAGHVDLFRKRYPW